MNDFTNLNQRIEYAPNPYNIQTTSILSVILNDDEEVEWLWSNTMDGKGYVSGYSLKKKRFCPNCKEKAEICACLRNICFKCGKPVGNITFTVCDDCWNKKD